MTADYDEIYSKFLIKITDYKFLGLDESDADEMMNSWMHSALAHPYIRSIFSSVTLDDDIGILEFEMDYPIDDDEDYDFTLEVISRGMVIEWLEPQVASVDLVKQMFGGKEQKFYSQAQQLESNRTFLNELKAKLRRFIADRGYINNEYID